MQTTSSYKVVIMTLMLLSTCYRKILLLANFHFKQNSFAFEGTLAIRACSGCMSTCNRCTPAGTWCVRYTPAGTSGHAHGARREEHAEVVEDLGIISDADQRMLQMGKEQKPSRELVQLWCRRQTHLCPNVSNRRLQPLVPGNRMERCHHLMSSPIGTQPQLSCRHLFAPLFRQE